MMSNIFRYDKRHESELIALLKNEPDWDSFTRESAIDAFMNALLISETYICRRNSEVCGYLRALVDGFGIYVSELYIAPRCRDNGYKRFQNLRLRSRARRSLMKKRSIFNDM